MSDQPFEPADPSHILLEAEEIVASLLKSKEQLVGKAFASLRSEPVEDLGKLLFVGAESGTAELPDLPELEEDWEAGEQGFVADDEDVESIMSELLEAHPEFALVAEPERRKIVIQVINGVLAEGL
ncbi:MAG TPA: hypothetical protein VFQ44_00545 [Streptosporangiaceae bacterium]|nr:hypothetical protein [Streptosporangiaceae bacterium]